jgi:hypothetical protein
MKDLDAFGKALVQVYMCPHTTIYVSSYYYIFWMPWARLLCRYKCVRMLLYICPHTTVYVSSYYHIFWMSLARLLCRYKCVRILLYIYRVHASVRVSSYVYTTVISMCQHTTVYIYASVLVYICCHMNMSSCVYVLILRIARGLLCSTFQERCTYLFQYICIIFYVYCVCVCVYIYILILGISRGRSHSTRVPISSHFFFLKRTHSTVTFFVFKILISIFFFSTRIPKCRSNL